MRKPTLQFASLEDLLAFCETAEIIHALINKPQLQLTAYLPDTTIELSQKAYGAQEVFNQPLSHS